MKLRLVNHLTTKKNIIVNDIHWPLKTCRLENAN